MLRDRFKSAVTALPEEAPAVELPTSLDDEFIQKVTELVKEGLGKNFNVDTLCASVNMSRTSFYSKLKALTGQAPADFVRNIRLKHAAELLKEGKYSVTEVAERTGFCDGKYFREVFKKYFNVSPSQYAKGRHSPFPKRRGRIVLHRRIFHFAAPHRQTLKNNPYFCRNKKTRMTPEIAIVDSNTLSCLGLQNLLEEIIPTAIIRSFRSFGD